MKSYHYLIIISSIVLLSFNTQRNPIHKKWRLVAEELTYFNPDYTKYDNRRDRLDSIKNETVQFLSDGSFKSRDGDGTYTVSNDSIHLSLNEKEISFKYELNNSKLIMTHDSNESQYIVRIKLYLE